jgi:hypothetical protein
VKRREFLKLAGAAALTTAVPVPSIPVAAPAVPYSLGAPLILFPTRELALRYSNYKFSAVFDLRRDA